MEFKLVLQILMLPVIGMFPYSFSVSLCKRGRSSGWDKEVTVHTVVHPIINLPSPLDVLCASHLRDGN
jgi:hypothetical protein